MVYSSAFGMEEITAEQARTEQIIADDDDVLAPPSSSVSSPLAASSEVRV